jgi:hypothetical protein
MSLGEVRDIAIVVLAGISVITTLVLFITALLLWRLIRVVSDEVRPILKSTAETAATIKAAATVASESTAADVVRGVASVGMAGKLFSIFRRDK